MTFFSKKFLYLIFCTLSLCIISSLYAQNTFTIDLSQSPGERWSQVVAHYDKQELREYAQTIDQSINTTIPVLKIRFVRKFLNSISWHISHGGETNQWFEDMHKELQGLAEALKQKMDGETLNGFREEDLFLLNIGYDFSTYCTTGVYISEHSNHPRPILFRNLDWNIDLFKKFTFEEVFTKDGKEIFKAISFLGQIGILTGIKSDGFAIALNYRKTNKKDYIFQNTFLANLKSALFNGGWSNSLLIRYSLEHDQNYDLAKARLLTTQLIAPSYITLAGTNATQAVVIERSRASTHNQRGFDNVYENKNFLVQTNHDLPIPTYQNEEWAENDPLLSGNFSIGTIKRRETAVSYLKQLSHSSVTTDNRDIEQKLLHMLTTLPPVFNEQTIFSAVLDPSNNDLIWQISRR